MSYLSWPSKKDPAPLSIEQASNMLKTLGTIDKNKIAQSKLSFCETDIVWMTSSGAVRSVWTALNTINASSWSCDLNMLPKLADRITQVYAKELAKIETSKQAADTASLFADAIVGLDTLKACHYKTQEDKSQLVTLAVNYLARHSELVVAKKGELEGKEAPIEAPAPVLLTPMEELKNRYEAFQKEYVALRTKVVAAASQAKGDFTTYADYSAIVKSSDTDQIEKQLPPEIPGDAEFNELRERFRRLIKLDMRLVIEAKGYGVTR